MSLTAAIYWTVIILLVGGLSVREVGWRITSLIAGLLLLGGVIAYLVGDADGMAFRRW